jgi:hypothetical protein
MGYMGTPRPISEACRLSFASSDIRIGKCSSFGRGFILKSSRFALVSKSKIVRSVVGIDKIDPYRRFAMKISLLILLIGAMVTLSHYALLRTPAERPAAE